MSEPESLEDQNARLLARVGHLELILIDRVEDEIRQANDAANFMEPNTEAGRAFLVKLQDHAAWIVILHILRSGENGERRARELLGRVQFKDRMCAAIKAHDLAIRQMDEGRGIRDVFQEYFTRHST